MTNNASVKSRLPAWLNGQTLAILTVVVAVGALMQTGFANLRAEVQADIGRLEAGQKALRAGQDRLRTEMLVQMERLRRDLRAEFQADFGELRQDIRGLDDRLRAVEVQLAALDVRLVAVEAELPLIRRDIGKLVPKLHNHPAALTQIPQHKTASATQP